MIPPLAKYAKLTLGVSEKNFNEGPPTSHHHGTSPKGPDDVGALELPPRDPVPSKFRTVANGWKVAPGRKLGPPSPDGKLGPSFTLTEKEETLHVSHTTSLTVASSLVPSVSPSPKRWKKGIWKVSTDKKGTNLDDAGTNREESETDAYKADKKAKISPDVPGHRKIEGEDDTC